MKLTTWLNWPTCLQFRCLTDGAQSTRSSAPHSCWAAACSQCARPSCAKIISPEIQQVAAELKLASQCAHTLSGHHPSDRRELHLPAKDTGLVRHQFSSRELSLLSVSHFWGPVQLLQSQSNVLNGDQNRGISRQGVRRHTCCAHASREAAPAARSTLPPPKYSDAL